MKMRDWKSGMVAIGQIDTQPFEWYSRWRQDGARCFFVTVKVVLDDKVTRVKAYCVVKPGDYLPREKDWVAVEFTPSPNRTTQYKIWSVVRPPDQHILYGYVTRDMHPSATYARIMVPNGSGCPLSLTKVTTGGINRDITKKNVLVQVMRTNSNDARTYRIVKVWSHNVDGGRTVEKSNRDGKENVMGMSKDRVRFTVKARRFDNTLFEVLERAFGGQAADEIASECENGKNVFLVCRPSQFARFLIYRNETGLANLFQELEPELFTPKKGDIVQQLADDLSVSRQTVMRLVQALGLDTDEVRKRVEGNDRNQLEVDASDVL